MGAALPSARLLPSRMVSCCSGTRRVRLERVRALADPHARPRTWHDPPGDGRPSRPDRRGPDPRRRRRALVPGRDGRRVGPLARPAVHGGETEPFLDGVPHGWSDGLAQAPGIVVAAISDRDGIRGACLARGCARHGARALVRLDRPRRPRRRRVPAWRSLAGRRIALSRARRARRSPPPRPPRRRPAYRRPARRTRRRWHVPRCALLVADLGRPPPRVQARARRRRGSRALGSRHGRADESRDRPARHGLGRRLVPRRVGAPAGERLRGPQPSVSLRARLGRALPDRDRARVRRESAGATGRSASGCSTSRVEGGGSFSTTREPRSSRSASRHPLRAPTSRGTSSTSTASRCTASS